MAGQDHPCSLRPRVLVEGLYFRVVRLTLSARRAGFLARRSVLRSVTVMLGWGKQPQEVAVDQSLHLAYSPRSGNMQSMLE